MITYLLPLLIGYTGGHTVHGQRGAVVGAIATMGVLVGSSVPMFIGAMVMGPLGGWCIKKFDDVFQDKIAAGFEMLVKQLFSWFDWICTFDSRISRNWSSRSIIDQCDG